MCTSQGPTTSCAVAPARPSACATACLACQRCCFLGPIITGSHCSRRLRLHMPPLTNPLPLNRLPPYHLLLLLLAAKPRHSSSPPLTHTHKPQHGRRQCRPSAGGAGGAGQPCAHHPWGGRHHCGALLRRCVRQTAAAAVCGWCWRLLLCCLPHQLSVCLATTVRQRQPYGLLNQQPSGERVGCAHCPAAIKAGRHNPSQPLLPSP